MLRRIPPVTRALLIANVVIFVLQQVFGDVRLSPFMLWPLGEPMAGMDAGQPFTAQFFPWQVLSYAFLHGDIGHLFFNMFALFMFGQNIERVLGVRRFGLYYVVCVLGAAAAQLVVATMMYRETGQPYPTIGASGGVFGILLAFAMMFPREKMTMVMLPFPINARTFVILYGLSELLMGIFYRGSGIAHFAHLGGMVAGFILLQYWKGQSRPGPRRL